MWSSSFFWELLAPLLITESTADWIHLFQINKYCRDLLKTFVKHYNLSITEFKTLNTESRLLHKDVRILTIDVDPDIKNDYILHFCNLQSLVLHSYNQLYLPRTLRNLVFAAKNLHVEQLPLENVTTLKIYVNFKDIILNLQLFPNIQKCKIVCLLIDLNTILHQPIICPSVEIIFAWDKILPFYWFVNVLHLYLTDCSLLTTLKGIENLRLTSLTLYELRNLVDISQLLSQTNYLKQLTITCCAKITNMSFILNALKPECVVCYNSIQEID